MSTPQQARSSASVPASVSRVRWALGAVGVLGGLYGAWLVLSRQEGLDRLVSVALWLAGGAVLHDVVLAPAVLLLAWATRGLPAAWRRPGIVAVVVLGSLTLLAVPVLGRFGARPDNATLLDRPYGWSWLALAVVTGLLVAVAGVVGSRRARASSDLPDGPGSPGSPDDDEEGHRGPGAGGR